MAVRVPSRLLHRQSILVESHHPPRSVCACRQLVVVHPVACLLAVCLVVVYGKVKTKETAISIFAYSAMRPIGIFMCVN